MRSSINLGVAGLGTVGTGLLDLLATHGRRMGDMLGQELKVVAVSARNREKHRNVIPTGAQWFDDPVKLACDSSVDIFVELIGGDEGPARASVEAALRSGKDVVTANKALLAKHGVALARLAEANKVALYFEAAVAGGIPVIKTLRESLAGNRVRRIYGILNGTCNYILTKMQQERATFADVLEEAQAKGYAEADPTFDIGGFDTAHKLCLLTSLAFGTEVALDQIDVEGIQSITAADIEAADELGYRIKLLGVALQTESGIEARVHPAMVPEESAIAGVLGVTNAVAIDGDFVGSLLLVGPGAGANPTASSVASDIIDISRDIVREQFLPPFRVPAAQLKPHVRAKLGAHQGAYYIRLAVHDKPGTMAVVAKRMGDQDVSLESIMQRRPKKPAGGDARVPGQVAPIILITHETTESAVRAAVDAIESDGKLAERPQVIRIEKL